MTQKGEQAALEITAVRCPEQTSQQGAHHFQPVLQGGPPLLTQA